MIYNVLDLFFGVIFNSLSLLFFIFGMYFHYTIIISRQSYNLKKIDDNFNADILGALGVGMKAIYFNFHKTDEHERENVIIVKSLKEIIPILL